MGFFPGLSTGPADAPSPTFTAGSACAANGTDSTNAPGSISSAGVTTGSTSLPDARLECANRSAATAGDATGTSQSHAVDGFTIAAAISPGWWCVDRALGNTSNTSPAANISGRVDPGNTIDVAAISPAADAPSQQRIDVTLGHTINTGRVRPDRTTAAAATGSRHTTSTCPAADAPGFVFNPLGHTVFPGFIANHAIAGCIAHATTVGSGWWHASHTVDGTRSSYPAITGPTTGPGLGRCGAAVVR